MGPPIIAAFSYRSPAARFINWFASDIEGEHFMNDDRLRGTWKQFRGRIREQWGRLTEDDLDVIAGKREQLLGRIQQRHGVAKDEAQRQVSDFERRNPDVSLDDTPGRSQS
jgi:uncharacterized protein YjbJ (UPF0337 family)